MKPILIFLLFTSTLCSAQKTNNSLGIGLGSIFILEDDFLYKQKVAFRSVFYNSMPERQAKPISAFSTTHIYFSKRIFRNFQFRVNALYNKRSFLIENIWPDQGTGEKYNKYSLLYFKTLELNLGIQYDIRIRKFKLYPAVEFATDLNRYFTKQYYSLTSVGPNQDFIEFKSGSFEEYFLNVLLGVEYRCSKSLSISYEGGMYRDLEAPLSRLSVNYNF